MGSTMQAFCCSDEKNEEKTDDQISSTNSALKSSIMGQKNLPTNDIIPLDNINKILEAKLTDEPHPFEDYVVIDFLGKGEYSEVYLIRNKKNNNIFALKKIKKNKSVNDDDIKQEIEKFKQLNHAYINNIYDYYIKDKYIFILEEFCSEGNLLDKIQKGKMFPEFIVKIIMLEIFKALIYLNSKNITHGNLKLQNILLELNDIKPDKKTNKKSLEYNEDKFINAINKDMLLIYKNIPNNSSIYKFDFKDEDSIKLINKKINESQKKNESAQMSSGLRFGFSKKSDDKLKAIPNLKYKGENNIYNSGKLEFLKYGIKINDINSDKICLRNMMTLDNISYFSPETLSENKSENCDVWTCGIIMYYLFCGSFPFIGNDIEEIKSKIISGKFIFDFDMFTGVSEDAKDLIKKCLKSDKELRIKLIDTVKHPFFDDLKDSKIYLIDEKKNFREFKKSKRASHILSNGPKFYFISF